MKTQVARPDPKELIIATRNRNKVMEIKEILRDLPLSLIPLYNFPSAPKFIEDGETFAENSEKKCRTIVKFLNVVAKLVPKGPLGALPEERFILAEDSGLIVEALGGKPGLYSARFAGPEQNDKKNIEKVLNLLKGIPREKRRCSFITVASLYVPKRGYLSFEGKREGYISFEPKGNFGFGYDPIFFDPEIGKTFGELPTSEKNKISHRYQAISKVKEFLLYVASYNISIFI